MATSYSYSAWLFTRALSLIYIVAFVSVAVQAKGLWGQQGILPIKNYLQAVETQIGPRGHWQLPTVFWLDSKDDTITRVAWVGVIFAALAFAGFAQGWMLLGCFIIYLSFVSAGQEFMSFQWDSLLLEVGFAALFAVPWAFALKWNVAVEPHWALRYVFYLILFKLMFLSGVVKILSGDESWRDMSALTYHYWTQPLPNPVSPFMHALPRFVHQASTALTFVIELALPFLMFWPRARGVAAVGFVALSLLILTTGNYTFFNWLTLALALWLVPDSFWRGLFERLPWETVVQPAPIFPHPLIAGISGVLALLTLIWCTRWFYSDRLMEIVSPVLAYAQTFHVSSSYGLFANMTKTRPEIVIEGSFDGKTWREYEFKYKPGNVYRRPPVVAPHQPRLDWQMWFAALGSFRQNPWVGNLMHRIFIVEPAVMGLFAWNPFSEGPPKYLRARLYEYEFREPSAIFAGEGWWKRRLLGDYTPIFERP